jgi:hypothetical protein
VLRHRRRSVAVALVVLAAVMPAAGRVSQVGFCRTGAAVAALAAPVSAFPVAVTFVAAAPRRPADQPTPRMAA